MRRIGKRNQHIGFEENDFPLPQAQGSSSRAFTSSLVTGREDRTTGSPVDGSITYGGGAVSATRPAGSNPLRIRYSTVWLRLRPVSRARLTVIR